jgi:hypothetical protein
MVSKKTILVALLVLALVPLTANATITRVIGLGGEGTAYVIRDAYTPNIWPQLIRDYPYLAGAEFYQPSGGSWDFQKAYINYDFGEDKCALQISLDKLEGRNYLSAPVWTGGTLPFDTVAGTFNRLSLIWGRPFGDYKVGLALNYTGKSYKRNSWKNPDNPNDSLLSEDASYATYGIRAGVTALENNLDLALGFEAPSFSWKEGGQELWKNDGSMTLGFAGRYWYKLKDTYSLIPNVKFSLKKDAGQMTQTDVNESNALTTTTIGAGIGNNWTPRENMLAVFEVGVMSVSNKSEFDQKNATAHMDTTSDSWSNSDFYVYWRLGFESKIFGWLNGRLGAERNWDFNTSEWQYVTYYGERIPSENHGKPEYGTAFTATYLGATAHWNRLYLDMLVKPAFFKNGPYFISGQSSDLLARVSLKYEFKE